jgi:hypothetical protein
LELIGWGDEPRRRDRTVAVAQSLTTLQIPRVKTANRCCGAPTVWHSVGMPRKSVKSALCLQTPWRVGAVSVDRLRTENQLKPICGIAAKPARHRAKKV